MEIACPYLADILLLWRSASMTKINTKGLSFLQPVGRGSKRGFGGNVGVSDGGWDAVLLPADAFVVDRIFEAVFVVIEAG
jgi:hypothetical protein